jgi:hypothetical protein
MLYHLVKDVCAQAADALAECDPVTAAVLRRASTPLAAPHRRLASGG